MKYELLLLRHGKSDWSVAVDDLHRPLTQRGVLAVERVGVWLAGNNLRPDLIICSPALRARDSAEKCRLVMGMKADQVLVDDRVYDAEADELCQVLRDHGGGCGRLLLVGHNPGLEEFLVRLMDQEPPQYRDGKLLPTAALAHLDLTTDWGHLENGRGQLREIVRARDLPKQFPFPDAFGTEWRKRPAYCYQHVAALPYRLKEGRLQLLFVRSGKKGDWQLPSGVLDPGLTPAVAAAAQARDLAGISGEAMEQALGSYSVKCWKAPCQVSLYPLRVESLPTDKELKKRRLAVRWMDIGEAQKKIADGPLRKFFPKLGKYLKQFGGAV
jgi:phosphohistidine phosphatase